MMFLWTCTIQITLILLMGLSVLPLLRRRSAAVRHTVLSVALLFAMLTPLFNLVMKSWNVSAALSQYPAVAPIGEQITAMALPAIRIWSDRDHLDSMSVSSPAAITSDESFRRLLPWMLWTMGIAVSVIILFIGLARLRRIARSSQPLTAGSWLRLAASISHDYGLKRPVKLLESVNSSILVTWGVIQPEVIVPAGASEWTEERAQIVLRHELAHIRRGDWLVQMIGQAVRAVYWFNPVVWFVCRQLRLESECACDDAVLSRDIAGHEYASHLLDLAHALNTPDRAWSSALMIARPSTIERRFSAMLNPTLNRQPVTRFALLASVLAGLAVTSALSVLTAATPSPLTMPPIPIAETAKVPPSALASQQPAPVQTPAPPVSVQRPNSPLPAGSPPVGQSVQRRRSFMDQALFDAAEQGDASDIEGLIRAGADVNAVLQGDGTPLIAAARRGRMENVRLLLDRGADPNIPVAGDGTPLIASAAKGHLNVVQLLLERGANISLQVPGDGNPLIMAAGGGHSTIVTLLLDRGASIDEIVPGDENPLIKASAEGRLDVVRLLVERKANVNARVWVEATPWRTNGEYRSALSEARKWNRQDVVQFLLSVGARD